jgi:signal transduction histidine kinase
MCAGPATSAPGRALLVGAERVDHARPPGESFPGRPPSRHGWRAAHEASWWLAPRTPGPLRRSATDPMLGGVAGGLSAKFGVNINLIRAVFIVLGLLDGFGFALYVGAWLAIPRSGESTSIARRGLMDKGGIATAVAFGSVLVTVLVTFVALGLSFAANLIWPVSLGSAGLVVVWRGAGEEEKAYLRELAERTPLLNMAERSRRGATIARVAVGVGLVMLGLVVLVYVAHPTLATEIPIVAAIVVIAGFLVVFGPWWLRIARELAVERRERVRSQERADMAVRVHDSVLQTLALIQRASGEPQEVIRLARAQERELRAWLFNGRAPGSFDESGASTLAAAVACIGRDVEESHGIAVEIVVVGDCPLSEAVEGMLAAGREATVNAAKWSGVSTVSLFVEVEAGQVSFFVRDRGRGFDPDNVAEDRRGITESITARMARLGGTATIRTGADQGTEVQLLLPIDVVST